MASVTVVALTLAAAACTDDGVDDGTAPTTTELTDETDVVAVDDPLAVPIYTDPTTLITATIGERFALVLPAEPTEGFRWEVVERPDAAVVLSLGSQFAPRDDLPPTTTTTTTPPPPEPEPAPPPADDVAPPPSDPVPEVAPPPTPPPPTTVPTRAVQVLSFVGRGVGRTTVTLRYLRIGAVPDESTNTVSFVIDIPDPGGAGALRAPALPRHPRRRRITEPGRRRPNRRCG